MLSFLIPQKYGGVKLSVSELSSVLTKIASVNPALGVITMVPNSLGPGELLTHYGTQEQKDYRQALRDLPSSTSPTLDEQGNLTNVTWPTKPS